VMAFTAIALAVVALPGCGDDTSSSGDDTDSESESDGSPPDSDSEPV